MLKRTIRQNGLRPILGAAVLALASGLTAPAAVAETVAMRVAVSSWVGYGPIFLAREKGFFEEVGLQVDIPLIEGASDRASAVKAGRLEGAATSLDAWTLFGAQGAGAIQVIALDESYGGDGIVAKNEIATVADLKGRSVAAQKGSASEFLLGKALAEEGLSLSDVNVIDMLAGDAGAAFVAGQVDAAVTWQPWLARARDTEFGRILKDTSDLPGIIVDTVGFSPGFVEAHPEAVQGFVDAVFRAIEYAQAHPEESNAVMAAAINMDADAFAETLQDLRFWDREANQEFFGDGGPDSPVGTLTMEVADFYQSVGLISTAPDLEDLVDNRFVAGP